MSELYRHLLISREAMFAPDLEQLTQFFEYLKAIGGLPEYATFTVVAETGRTRLWGTNAKTGEEYFGPELKISRFVELKDAVECALGEQNFDLAAEATGPAVIEPFELYDADNYASRLPGARYSKAYEFTVRCKQRDKITHVLHSVFGRKSDLMLGEPAVFENPWNHEPIQTGALGGVRFWIEFGIGSYLMPKVRETLDVLDPRMVAAANDVFGVKFDQGCIRNDD
ncbi:MAG: hypothetical protein ABSG84_17850 [Acidobacteriaceae bacterium]|jgi:hypothetical protein